MKFTAEPFRYSSLYCKNFSI